MEQESEFQASVCVCIYPSMAMHTPTLVPLSLSLSPSLLLAVGPVAPRQPDEGGHPASQAGGGCAPFSPRSTTPPPPSLVAGSHHRPCTPNIHRVPISCTHTNCITTGQGHAGSCQGRGTKEEGKQEGQAQRSHHHITWRQRRQGASRERQRRESQPHRHTDKHAEMRTKLHLTPNSSHSVWRRPEGQSQEEEDRRRVRGRRHSGPGRPSTPHTHTLHETQLITQKRPSMQQQTLPLKTQARACLGRPL